MDNRATPPVSRTRIFWAAPSLAAGVFVAVVGGIVTYFAIANSGFIPWQLAGASFMLVLTTKLPLAMLAGWLLEPDPTS